MAVCTFFGHRDCSDTVRPALRRVVVELIEGHKAEVFYVGDRGSFDRMVRGILRELVPSYPHIRYAVVLAYLPGPLDREEPDTMLPEGLELVCPKYAISRRNDWMLRHADMVVTYVTHPWGGAAKFSEKARRMGKQVFSLAQL